MTQEQRETFRDFEGREWTIKLVRTLKEREGEWEIVRGPARKDVGKKFKSELLLDPDFCRTPQFWDKLDPSSKQHKLARLVVKDAGNLLEAALDLPEFQQHVNDDVRGWTLPFWAAWMQSHSALAVIIKNKGDLARKNRLLLGSEVSALEILIDTILRSRKPNWKLLDIALESVSVTVPVLSECLLNLTLIPANTRVTRVKTALKLRINQKTISGTMPNTPRP